MHYFVDLGGVVYYDINFDSKNGFPLKLAAAKGRYVYFIYHLTSLRDKL